MQLFDDEQPVKEPKDKPDNKPALANADERINLRREIITGKKIFVLNYIILFIVLVLFNFF